MAKRPGRLYRVLADCPKPIFKVSGATRYSRTDDGIHSITVKHGQDDATGGVPVATAEVGFTGYVSPEVGETFKVELTPEAATYLSTLTGASNIAPRYFGRTGLYSVDDTGKRVDSTVTASSWHSQLSNRRRVHAFPRGRWVHEALTTLLTAPSLAQIPTITRGNNAAREKFGQIYDPVADAKYSDVIGKLTSDIGVLVRQRRNGHLELTPLAQRRADATTALASFPPIARSQVIAPTTWATDWENDPTNHRIVTRDGAMAPVSLNFGNLAETWRDTRETDLQYLYFADNDQWTTLGEAGRYSEYTGAYKLPQIEIDLLALFRRGKPYDLLVAGQVLALEQGAAVAFSGDWYPHFQAVMFAEGITETISSDTWSITLNLVPLGRVTGELPTKPKPRIWDQANIPWDEAPGTWNSY